MLSGCAAISPTQVGQTTGTLAGAAIVPGIGAPLGALVGMLAGLLVEQQVDKVREQKERVELAKELNSPRTAPSSDESGMRLGQPTRVWVDEQWKDGRIIVGHFEVRTFP